MLDVAVEIGRPAGAVWKHTRWYIQGSLRWLALRTKSNVGWNVVGDVSTESSEKEEKKKKSEVYAPRRKISYVAASLVWLGHARLCDQDPPNSPIHQPGTSVSGLSLIRNIGSPVASYVMLPRALPPTTVQQNLPPTRRQPGMRP
jgi:hypothetical protein